MDGPNNSSKLRTKYETQMALLTLQLFIEFHLNSYYFTKVRQKLIILGEFCGADFEVSNSRSLSEIF